MVASRVRIVVAWASCLAVVAAGAVGGFRGVAAWARPAFEDHRRSMSVAGPSVGEVVGAVTLADGVVVRQEFDSLEDGLAGLRVRTVTWGTTPDDYGCNWSLVELAPDGRSLGTIRSGVLFPAAARDWGTIDLRFPPIQDSLAARYALRITAGPGTPARPLGLPLFRTVGTAAEVAVRRRGGGDPPEIPHPAMLDVRVVHAREGE